MLRCLILLVSVCLSMQVLAIETEIDLSKARRLSHLKVDFFSSDTIWLDLLTKGNMYVPKEKRTIFMSVLTNEDRECLLKEIRHQLLQNINNQSEDYVSGHHETIDDEISFLNNLVSLQKKHLNLGRPSDLNPEFDEQYKLFQSSPKYESLRYYLHENNLILTKNNQPFMQKIQNDCHVKLSSEIYDSN